MKRKFSTFHTDAITAPGGSQSNITSARALYGDKAGNRLRFVPMMGLDVLGEGSLDRGQVAPEVIESSAARGKFLPRAGAPEAQTVLSGLGGSELLRQYATKIGYTPDRLKELSDVELRAEMNTQMGGEEIKGSRIYPLGAKPLTAGASGAGPFGASGREPVPMRKHEKDLKASALKPKPVKIPPGQTIPATPSIMLTPASNSTPIDQRGGQQTPSSGGSSGSGAQLLTQPKTTNMSGSVRRDLGTALDSALQPGTPQVAPSPQSSSTPSRSPFVDEMLQKKLATAKTPEEKKRVLGAMQMVEKSRKKRDQTSASPAQTRSKSKSKEARGKEKA